MDATEKGGQTPLHEAAFGGYADIVKVEKALLMHKPYWLCCLQILIDAGANIDATDGIGETPLHEASEYGHLDVAEVRGRTLFYSGSWVVAGLGRSGGF